MHCNILFSIIKKAVDRNKIYFGEFPFIPFHFYLKASFLHVYKEPMSMRTQYIIDAPQCSVFYHQKAVNRKKAYLSELLLQSVYFISNFLYLNAKEGPTMMRIQCTLSVP